MKRTKPKKLKRRLYRSWMSSAVSISLVLFMLGALLLVLINAQRLSDYVREKIGFTLVLQEDVKEVDIIRLQKGLTATNFVKSTQYIDRETAARRLTEELGEDFTGFLGYNPLYASVDVKLYAPYTKNDSLLVIEKKLLEYPQVKEVFYHKNLVALINENVQKISLVLLVISGLLGSVFLSLINNTLRISIYSKRFTINTMQLVGAPRSFVRKPFLLRALTLGILGALIANTLLFLSIFSFKQEFAWIINPAGWRMLGTVFILVTALGMAISYFSTYIAVNKFLKMKFDELFY